MSPAIPVSWGELIDKITILEIKSELLESEVSRHNVRRELEQLSAVAAAAEKDNPKIASLKVSLKHANQTLWQIEDDIREKEAAKCFDQEFVDLARAIYRTNDERGRIKQAINALLKSEVTEEKQYSRY
jgi:hypothetical protein